MKGFSLILGKGVKHFGSFARGLWFDKNAIFTNKNSGGWGFKFDIVFGHSVRPKSHLFKLWFDKELVGDTPEDKYVEVFGEDLAGRLALIDPEYIRSRPRWNPWFCENKGVSRGGDWYPRFFLSISTPFRRAYVGWKCYDCDCGMESNMHDMSWVEGIDIERANKNNKEYVTYLCLSASNRKPTT